MNERLFKALEYYTYVSWNFQVDVVAMCSRVSLECLVCFSGNPVYCWASNTLGVRKVSSVCDYFSSMDTGHRTNSLNVETRHVSSRNLMGVRKM